MNSTKKAEDIKTQLRELVKQTLQEAYEAEIEEFVGYPRRNPPKGADSKSFNTRNGYGKKRVKSDSGEVELEVPPGPQLGV
jgi:transposase-like protein